MNIYWLVVSAPLKNMSQLGVLFPIYGKIKKCSKPPTSVYIICIMLHIPHSYNPSRVSIPESFCRGVKVVKSIRIPYRTDALYG